MSGLDAGLVLTAALSGLGAALWAIPRFRNGNLSCCLLALPFPALLILGLSKVHLLLPAASSAIDQVTFWVLFCALVLQAISGLATIMYRDLNRAKDLPEGLNAILNVPRRIPLSLDTEITDHIHLENEKLAARGRGRRLEHVGAELLPVLRYQGNSPISWLYSRPAHLRDGTDQGEVIRIYSMRRPYDLEVWDIEAAQRLFRQLSLLAIGAMALIRFIHDEPILNLF